jgi:DNA polymerase-3 subunit beta
LNQGAYLALIDLHRVVEEGKSAMKVSVLQENLAHGLSIVSRAVSPRSTLPVLANVLVATDEGRLRLSATNLEIGITCWIGAKIEEEGSTTVPARTFSDLVNTLPARKRCMSALVPQIRILNASTLKNFPPCRSPI